MVKKLRQHDVYLCDGPLVLRPMTENDWDILLKWHNDPKVLYYSEGDNIKSRPLAEVQDIYRGVSEEAFNFIAELDERPIGDCWLQEMNLERILSRHPKEIDLRRIDLAIGEKDLWAQGWGTRIIGLLTGFAFEDCGAEGIFGCEVADYNPRSMRAFEKNGYLVDQIIPQEPGRKAKEVYDLVLTRHRYYDSLNGLP